jgi:hypothetical protein
MEESKGRIDLSDGITAIVQISSRVQDINHDMLKVMHDSSVMLLVHPAHDGHVKFQKAELKTEAR